jgi:hypothetical protein
MHQIIEGNSGMVSNLHITINKCMLKFYGLFPSQDQEEGIKGI